MREAWKVIKDKQYKMGVELGSLRGENAKECLMAIPDLKLVLIDNNRDGGLGILINNLKEFSDRVCIYGGSSEEARNKVKKRSVDFVYIDASHEYEDVKNDLEWWFPKIIKGGLLCGHDYTIQELFQKINQSSTEDVGRAVREFAQRYKLEVHHGINEKDGQGNEDFWIFL
jgi:predicted O-methyltransferase YrrM